METVGEQYRNLVIIIVYMEVLSAFFEHWSTGYFIKKNIIKVPQSDWNWWKAYQESPFKSLVLDHLPCSHMLTSSQEGLWISRLVESGLLDHVEDTLVRITVDPEPTLGARWDPSTANPPTCMFPYIVGKRIPFFVLCRQNAQSLFIYFSTTHFGKNFVKTFAVLSLQIFPDFFWLLWKRVFG